MATAFILAACGGPQPGSEALAPTSPSTTPLTSPTPLPSGVVDPQSLVRHVKGLTAIVLRVDDIATKLMPSSEYLGPGNVPGPSMIVPATVWVVAVVGDIRPSFGVMARPNSQCGLFAFRADTGEVWSGGEGSLAVCQPYFARRLANTP